MSDQPANKPTEHFFRTATILACALTVCALIAILVAYIQLHSRLATQSRSIAMLTKRINAAPSPAVVSDLEASQNRLQEEVRAAVTSLQAIEPRQSALNKNIEDVTASVSELSALPEDIRAETKDWQMDYVRSLIQLEKKIDGIASRTLVLENRSSETDPMRQAMDIEDIKRQIQQIKENMDALVKGLSLRPQVTIDQSTLHPELLETQ